MWQAITLFPVVFVFATFLLWLARPHDRPRAERLLCLALAVLVAQWIIGLTLLQITHLNLPTYDLYVYRLDGLLGFQPSFVLGRLLLPHARFMYLLNASYQSLLIVATILLAVAVWRNEPDIGTMIRAFALNCAFAPLIYLLIPVCGPGFAFQGVFPDLPPAISPHIIHLHAQPNGIPSIHLSTALLVCWFSRRWKLGRILASIYLVLTVLATLGSGEHYLLDLLVSIPYSIGVVWLAQPATRRSTESPTEVDPLYGIAVPTQRSTEIRES